MNSGEEHQQTVCYQYELGMNSDKTEAMLTGVQDRELRE